MTSDLHAISQSLQRLYAEVPPDREVEPDVYLRLKELSVKHNQLVSFLIGFTQGLRK